MKNLSVVLCLSAFIGLPALASVTQCDGPQNLTTAYSGDNESVSEKTINQIVSVGDPIIVLKTSKLQASAASDSDYTFTHFSPLNSNLSITKGKPYEVIATFGDAENKLYAINISQKMVTAVALINSQGALCRDIYTKDLDKQMTKRTTYSIEAKEGVEYLPFLITSKPASQSSSTTALILSEFDSASIKFEKIRSVNGRVVQRQPILLDAFEKEFNIAGLVLGMKKSGTQYDVKVIKEPVNWLKWRNGV